MKKPNRIFRGSQEEPFLAPRGIAVSEEIMAICDTAHNKVYIWDHIPTTEYQEPTITLGIDTTSCSATSFYYPSGIWTDGKKLLIADAWNHRVLIWHQFPSSNFTPADVVIGQVDFESNLPNTKGVNFPPTNQSLYWCYGLWSNGTELWIADTGNRRIIYFDTIPVNNFAPATAVIGQPNFVSRDLNPNYPTWPYAISISDKGEMLIPDTQYYRVLYWKKWQDAFVHPADIILGQNNFVDKGQNQFRLKPNGQSLNWVYDAKFDRYSNKIIVADTGNSRVLIWNKVPEKNNCEADEVLGQLNMDVLGENKESIMGQDNFMYWPFSVTSTIDSIIVCETGNNRIFIYDK